MSLEKPWRVIFIGEGSDDERRIPHLVDHFLSARYPLNTLQEIRRYEGLDGYDFIRVKSIPALVRARGLDRRYSSDGPQKGDAGSIRKLFHVLQKEKLLDSNTVVIWSRDDDGDDSRRRDVEQALRDLPARGTWILAIARECGEAWIIAGFTPTSREDQEKLRDIRQRFGFAPHEYPERLSHKEDHPKSAKKVRELLFEEDNERELSALIAATVPGHSPAIACGLHHFCKQIDAWLGD